METFYKSNSIEVKGLYKGELILKRYSGSEGIYCIEFELNGKIPEGVYSKIIKKYFEYKDNNINKYKRLNCWCDRYQLVLECRISDYEKLYNFVYKMLLSYK